MPKAGLAPLGRAAVAAVALWAAFFVVEGALGRLPLALEEPRDFRLAIVQLGMLAYLPAARRLVVDGARERVRELSRFVAATPAEMEAFAVACGRASRAVRGAAGAIGVGLAFAIPLLVRPGAPDAYEVASWTPEVVWHRVSAPCIGWLLAGLAVATVVESRRISALAGRIDPFDLLDLRCAQPFVRCGLRNALVHMGLVSFFSLFLLDEGFRELVGVLVGTSVAIAAVGFVLPLHGLLRRIRVAKRAELARCDAEIRRARDAIAEGAGARDGRLADAVAHRALIDAVRGWPFDAPTALRFALYLGLPLGSWLGGALVERLVGALFG